MSLDKNRTAVGVCTTAVVSDSPVTYSPCVDAAVYCSLRKRVHIYPPRVLLRNILSR